MRRGKHANNRAHLVQPVLSGLQAIKELREKEGKGLFKKHNVIAITGQC